MVRIENLESFLQAIETETASIKYNTLVVGEDDFSSRVQDATFKKGIGLIGVIPTAIPSGDNEDNVVFSEVVSLYFVKKWEEKEGYAAYLHTIKETQLAVIDFLKLISKKLQECAIYKQFEQLKIETSLIDPVSNYHGTVGYNVEFTIINPLT
jgi:hypothetical protein